MFEVTKRNIIVYLFYFLKIIHTDRELLLIIEFRSDFFRDLLLLLLFLGGLVDEEFIVSFFPLCRLTISPITRRSE